MIRRLDLRQPALRDHASTRSRARLTAQALEPGAELQVFPHPHVLVQRIVLRHVTDPAPHFVRVRRHIQARHPRQPEVAGMKQERMRMVVLLPAPFGPSRPTISPRPTVKETSATAVFPA